jgi:hypothetical protein
MRNVETTREDSAWSTNIEKRDDPTTDGDASTAIALRRSVSENRKKKTNFKNKLIRSSDCSYLADEQLPQRAGPSHLFRVANEMNVVVETSDRW